MLLAARLARAAPEHFGDAHQVVIDQRFNVNGLYSKQGDDFPLSGFGLTLAPAASYFVAPRVSLGIHTLLNHASTHYDVSNVTQTMTFAQVGPSVGYALRLSEHFALWPQLEATYGKIWMSSNNGIRIPSASTVSGSVAVPLLWLPAEHFFVGIGPTLGWASGYLENDAFQGDRVVAGLSSTLGGYFSP